MNMSKEKFTQGELIACESYADNGALSHYTFVDENGDIIGIFCDEDALIKNRMDREKAYAILFAAAPEMYRMLEQLHGVLTSVPLLQGEIEAVLKKARSEK